MTDYGAPEHQPTSDPARLHDYIKDTLTPLLLLVGMAVVMLLRGERKGRAELAADVEQSIISFLERSDLTVPSAGEGPGGLDNGQKG